MKNLLFVSIEDLNDFIEPLGGHPQVRTPNINRLVGRGHLFRHAYTTAPACSPARAAVMFGVPPWESGVYSNAHQWFNAFDPDTAVSLFGALRQNGFQTWGTGKMFYGGYIAREWDGYHREPNDPYPRMSALQKAYDVKAEMMDYGSSPQEGPLYDERNAGDIIARMTRGAEGQVWSVGIYRPHLPFIAPQRFFDLYPDHVQPVPGLKSGIFDPDNASETEGIAREARNKIVRNVAFGRKLHGLQDYSAFLRAYLASVSYADHVLGLLLDRLEEQGLRDSTHVVLWSDHGYHFGEKNKFHKFSLWERSLRIPLVFAGPGIAAGVSDEPVSNIDIGPTVLDLLDCARTGNFASGHSLRPVLCGAPGPTRAPVVSAYGFDVRKPDTDKTVFRLAWSVRNSRYRLIRYWGSGLELYDHTADPHEWVNLIPEGDRRNTPAALRDVVADLEACLPGAPAAPTGKTKGRRPASTDDSDLPHWVRIFG